MTPSPLDRTEFAAARADHRLSESIEPSTGATRLVIIILSARRSSVLQTRGDVWE